MSIKEHSLWIGAMLKSLLEGIAPVYPLIAEYGAPETFITYRRSGYTASNTKDRFNYRELINVEVSVISPTYEESLQKASFIKAALDNQSGRWEDIFIDKMQMINAYENYRENAYIQTLVFAIAIDPQRL